MATAAKTTRAATSTPARQPAAAARPSITTESAPVAIAGRATGQSSGAGVTMPRSRSLSRRQLEVRREGARLTPKGALKRRHRREPGAVLPLPLRGSESPLLQCRRGLQVPATRLHQQPGPPLTKLPPALACRRRLRQNGLRQEAGVLQAVKRRSQASRPFTWTCRGDPWCLERHTPVARSLERRGKRRRRGLRHLLSSQRGCAAAHREFQALAPAGLPLRHRTR